MARFLVTGGAGFIGSHLAEALIRRHQDVVVLDNYSTGKKANIEYLSSLNGDLKIIEGDTADPKTAKQAVKSVDVIFHQAALGSVPKSVADPAGTHRANATGTLEMLIAAKNEGVRRFINAASSSAYGETEVLPKSESQVPSPRSPYAVTKLCQEEYCHAFSASYGLQTVSLRYFNVYGPRQDPHSQYAAVIPTFFQSYLNGKSPLIYGDGKQTRDFTFIEDVVAANLAASEYPDAKGQVFNIAGGHQIAIEELAEKISKLVGSSLAPKYADARPGDIRHSLADISRAKNELGWAPKVNLEKGLRLTFDWYQAQFK